MIFITYDVTLGGGILLTSTTVMFYKQHNIIVLQQTLNQPFMDFYTSGLVSLTSYFM